MLQSNNALIVRNTVVLYIRSIVILFISLYTTRVVLRTLGADDYGVQNVVGGFVAMFGFLNASMTKAIQRFYNFAKGSNDSQRLSSTYTNSLLIQALLATVITSVTEIAGLWALSNYLVIPSGREQAAFWVFQLATMSMIFVIMSAPYSAAIIAHERMKVYAFISILDALLKLGFVFALPYAPFDKLVTYASLGLVTSIINFGINVIYSKRHFHELVFSRKAASKKDFKDILSFSGWNILAAFSNIMKTQGVNILLNRFFGTIVNAARGVSHQILVALKMLVDNIQVAVKPQLVQSYAKGDLNRTFDLMFFTSKISFVLMYLFALPIVLEIEQILYLWLGDAVPIYSAVFTIITILVSLIECLNAPVSFVIQATGKMKRYHLTYSIILLLIVPVSYVALKLGADPTSVFWVSFCVGVVNQIACLVVLKLEVPFSIRAYVKRVVFPCFYTFALSPIIPLVLRYTMPETILRAFLVVGLSLFVTAIIIYYLACNKQERYFIQSLVSRKIKA